MRSVSTFRLYLLRAFYLVLVVGLGIEIWPTILYHVYSMSIASGAETCMLWALSVLSLLGLRYPLKMLPLLLFEITWKLAWLLTVALPHWSRGQWNARLSSSTFAIGLVVLFIPFVPWSYVLEQYVRKPGAPWRGGERAASSP